MLCLVAELRWSVWIEEFLTSKYIWKWSGTAEVPLYFPLNDTRTGENAQAFFAPKTARKKSCGGIDSKLCHLYNTVKQTVLLE